MAQRSASSSRGEAAALGCLPTGWAACLLRQVLCGVAPVCVHLWSGLRTRHYTGSADIGGPPCERLAARAPSWHCSVRSACACVRLIINASCNLICITLPSASLSVCPAVCQAANCTANGRPAAPTMCALLRASLRQPIKRATEATNPFSIEAVDPSAVAALSRRVSAPITAECVFKNAHKENSALV